MASTFQFLFEQNLSTSDLTYAASLLQMLEDKLFHQQFHACKNRITRICTLMLDLFFLGIILCILKCHCSLLDSCLNSNCISHFENFSVQKENSVAMDVTMRRVLLCTRRWKLIGNAQFFSSAYDISNNSPFSEWFQRKSFDDFFICCHNASSNMN